MEIENNLLHPTAPRTPPINVEEIPTPDTPPWGPFAAIGVWLASVAFILVIPTLFLLPYIAMQQPPIVDRDQIVEFAKSDPTSILLQILAILPAHILTLLLAWIVVTRVRRFSFQGTLGWGMGGFKWWHFILILGGFLIFATIVSLVFPEQENDLVRILHSSRSAVYIIAFVATFTAPLVEEVVYRGVLYSAFQRSIGMTAAFVLVTLLFALVHVPQYYPSYPTIFLLGCLSLILTAIRVRTKNLLPCIILHTLFNGMQSLLLILEPMMRSSSEVPPPAATLFHLLK